MKTVTLIAATAGFYGLALAGHQQHQRLHKKGDSPASTGECGCTTSVVTWYGESTLVTPTKQTTTTILSTTTVLSTAYQTVIVSKSGDSHPDHSTCTESPTMSSVTGSSVVPLQELGSSAGPRPSSSMAASSAGRGLSQLASSPPIPASSFMASSWALSGTSQTTSLSIAVSPSSVAGSKSSGSATLRAASALPPPASPSSAWPVGFGPGSSQSASSSSESSTSCSETAVSGSSTSFAGGQFYASSLALSLNPSTSPSSTMTTSGQVYTSPSIASSAAVSSAASSTKSSSADPSSGSGNAPITPNGNQWAMTYSPYTSGGSCKDASSVEVDIALISSKGFTTIRIYSTDCSSLVNVGAAARAHRLKLIIGVYISATGIAGAQEQVTDIVSWAEWDLVSLAVIGNEVIFNHYTDAASLAVFISESKAKFSASGYTGPVTTTEPVNIWQESGSALCSSIDILAANVHPFFNSAVSSSDAGKFVQDEIDILVEICGDKTVYVMETGWPSSGQANGLAVPSPSDQAAAIKSIQTVVGAKVTFFSYENEKWKPPGELGVEQSWGCVDHF